MNEKTSKTIRRRQAEIDDRLDPSWQPGTESPVFSPATIRYEISGRTTAVQYGGLGLIHQLVQHVGLIDAIDKNLPLLKRHLPYHESDHILNLTYNIVTGGKCLEDLEIRRQDVGYLNALGAHRIPDPTTEGDFLRRFLPSHVETLMGSINSVRRNIWLAQPEERRRLAVIDVDGLIAETTGDCKEGADFAYNKKWGYAPLVVSLANTREPLFVVNRPGNRPSHDGSVKWMDKGILWARESGFGGVRLRGDTDYSLTANFDRWTSEKVQFNFGIDAHANLVSAAENLSEDCWKHLGRRRRRLIKTEPRKKPTNYKSQVVKVRGYRNLRLKSEHIAEVQYRPKKCSEHYRLIILRKTLNVEEGQQQLEDEIKYFFYITNISKKEMSTADVIRDNNARCEQENLIEQLRNGVSAMRMPTVEFVANWAYMVIATLAWSLKIWLGLLAPPALGGKEILRMEFRTFVNWVIHVPAQILLHSRRLVFRLLSFSRWTRFLISCSEWFRRHRLCPS